jgi:HAD superfamily phosphoserine phosphatase-like hydrolase
MKLTILDFDNTLSEGFSRYELGYAMEEIGMIKHGLKAEIEELQLQYEEGQISYNTKFDDDKKIFSKYYEGVSKLETERFLRDEFDLESKIFPWSKDLIAKMREEDYLVVVISGCWDFVIEYAQELLEFDSFFATSFKIETGLFTNEYTRIIDHKKKEVYSKQLLTEATKSIGIGDSAADLEYLKLVDHGFLIDPKQDAIDQITTSSIKITNSDNIVQLVEAVL